MPMAVNILEAYIWLINTTDIGILLFERTSVKGFHLVLNLYQFRIN